MKLIPILALAAICTACSSTGNVNKGASTNKQTTEATASSRTLPIEERAFVKAIETLTKKEILAEVPDCLGKPCAEMRTPITETIRTKILFYDCTVWSGQNSTLNRGPLIRKKCPLLSISVFKVLAATAFDNSNYAH